FKNFFILMYFRILFFFLQAEDGIRVFHVTGVQTLGLNRPTNRGQGDYPYSRCSSANQQRPATSSGDTCPVPNNSANAGVSQALGHRVLLSIEQEKRTAERGPHGCISVNPSGYNKRRCYNQ